MIMSKIKDLTGQHYGRLTVLDYAGSDKRGKATWRCTCECGNTATVDGYDLRHGHTTSCGCLRREIMREIGKRSGEGKHPATHGMAGTRLYNVWIKMKGRCSNPNSDNYKHYGGRGITVCTEWVNSFETFRDWALANGYRDDLTIDRIDNDGPYCPDNCRWVSMTHQANNRRSNRCITFNGKTQTTRQWADELGIPYEVLRRRFDKGWSAERALTTQSGGTTA